MSRSRPSDVMTPSGISTDSAEDVQLADNRPNGLGLGSMADTQPESNATSRNALRFIFAER